MTFLVTVLGIAWRVFVLTQLWQWFVVPLGAPMVPFWHAVGLYMFANMVILRITSRDIQCALELQEAGESDHMLYLANLLYAGVGAIVLAIGYVAKGLL